MELKEAVELIRPALESASGTWADFGAGTGTFTRALVAILGEGSSIIAIDRDARALTALRSQDAARDESKIVTIKGDIEKIDEIPELANIQLDGALFANALHFLREPERVLARAAERVRAGGRIVVIEYDVETASRWVPYPLPYARLQAVAPPAGLTKPQLLGRRESAFRGSMYCAAATVSHQ